MLGLLFLKGTSDGRKSQKMREGQMVVDIKIKYHLG